MARVASAPTRSAISPRRSAPALEAHLEGCPSCRAELEQLAALVRAAVARRPGPLRVGAAAAAPRSAPGSPAAIARERLGRRRRRLRFGLALGGAAAAVAAALGDLRPPGGGEATGPEQHVTFASLPQGMKISREADPQRLRDRDPHVREGRLAPGPSAASTCAAATARGSRPAPSATAGATAATRSSAPASTSRRPTRWRCGSATAPTSPRSATPTSERSSRTGGTTMTRHLTALVLAIGGARAPSPPAAAATAARRARAARRRLRRRIGGNRRRPAAPTPGSAGGGATSSRWRRCRSWARSSSTPNGFTLYDFHKDKGTTSSCYGACAGVWPPLTTEGEPTGRRWGCPPRSWARPSARTAPTQVTFAGHPLYTYTGGHEAGRSERQRLRPPTAAEWYALMPSGEEAGGLAPPGRLTPRRRPAPGAARRGTCPPRRAAGRS